MARVRRSRRLDELRNRACRSLSPGRRLRRSDSQGRKTRRSASPAVDQVRVRDQPQDRQVVGTRGAAASPADRRRGDRVAIPIAALHESAFGPKRTLVFALQMSAFGGKADMGAVPGLLEGLGTELRPSQDDRANHTPWTCTCNTGPPPNEMSAYDPKRT